MDLKVLHLYVSRISLTGSSRILGERLGENTDITRSAGVTISAELMPWSLLWLPHILLILIFKMKYIPRMLSVISDFTAITLIFVNILVSNVLWTHVLDFISTLLSCLKPCTGICICSFILQIIGVWIFKLFAIFWMLEMSLTPFMSLNLLSYRTIVHFFRVLA